MKSQNKCLQSARSALFWRDRYYAVFERESGEQSRPKQIKSSTVPTVRLRGTKYVRLVTIDLSVDFRLVKPVNVRKRELVVKTEKNCEVTSRSTALRSSINDYDL